MSILIATRARSSYSRTSFCRCRGAPRIHIKPYKLMPAWLIWFYIYSHRYSRKKASPCGLALDKFKILTLLLNGTYINTLYEVLLTEWIDDHERKNSNDCCCVTNCFLINSIINWDITINNHVS